MFSTSGQHQSRLQRGKAQSGSVKLGIEGYATNSPSEFAQVSDTNEWPSLRDAVAPPKPTRSQNRRQRYYINDTKIPVDRMGGRRPIASRYRAQTLDDNEAPLQSRRADTILPLRQIEPSKAWTLKSKIKSAGDIIFLGRTREDFKDEQWTSLTLLALRGCYFLGIEPIKIFLRAPVHHTSFLEGKRVPDRPHSTISVLSTESFSDEHETLHCYTWENWSSECTDATKDPVKPNASKNLKGNAIWPNERSLIRLPQYLCPDVDAVRKAMIEKSVAEQKMLQEDKELREAIESVEKLKVAEFTADSNSEQTMVGEASPVNITSADSTPPIESVGNHDWTERLFPLANKKVPLRSHKKTGRKGKK